MPLLIFSGSNDRAVIAFCRYAKASNISFSIIANGNDDYIFNTDYQNEVIATRKKNELNLKDIISYAKNTAINTKGEKVIILPTTEYLNRFLLTHQTELRENNIESGLCDKEIYELVSDKYSFGQACEDFGLNVPQEFDSKPSKYPFVIKSKKYGNDLKSIHDKPALIYSETEYTDYMKGKEERNYFYQDYIEGQSFYLLYYISKDGSYSVFSQKNLMQQSEGGSMILCQSSDFHKDKITEKYARLFSSVGFWGIVMVEIIQKGSEFYMIEANPRLWGPSQLILDSGMDLFDCFSKDNKLVHKTHKKKYLPGIYYFWSGGLLKTLSKTHKPKYYDFAPKKFNSDYDKILNHEVYLRPDTLKIYLNENTNE